MAKQADEHDEVYRNFNTLVNMAPRELEDWLGTEASRSVGDRGDDEEAESTGHRSGRRIVQIKRTVKDELTDDQYAHMQKVVGYIRRHTAQRPSGDVTETPWRYSLMNWGHDPLKD